MAHKRSKPTESTSAMERQQSGSNVEYSFDEEAIVNIQKRLAFALRICTQEKTVKYPLTYAGNSRPSSLKASTTQWAISWRYTARRRRRPMWLD